MAKILLVDDEPKVLRSLTAALELDHEIHISACAADAQVMVGQDGPFDAIISDEVMPGIKGHEFLNWCRQNSPNSKRVLLTGLPINKELKEDLDAVGNVSVLSKPWSLSDIQTALQTKSAVNDEYGAQGVEGGTQNNVMTIVLLNPDEKDLQLYNELAQSRSLHIVSCDSIAKLVLAAEQYADAKKLVLNISEATKGDLRLLSDMKNYFPNASILVTAIPKIVRELNAQQSEQIPFKLLVKPYSLGRLRTHLAIS